MFTWTAFKQHYRKCKILKRFTHKSINTPKSPKKNCKLCLKITVKFFIIFNYFKISINNFEPIIIIIFVLIYLNN